MGRFFISAKVGQTERAEAMLLICRSAGWFVSDVTLENEGLWNGAPENANGISSLSTFGGLAPRPSAETSYKSRPAVRNEAGLPSGRKLVLLETGHAKGLAVLSLLPGLRQTRSGRLN
jgi:hypothetical protein